MTEIRQKILAGIGWSVVSQVARQVLVVAIVILLARLLSPREFGLIAMVTVFAGFAELLPNWDLVRR